MTRIKEQLEIIFTSIENMEQLLKSETEQRVIKSTLKYGSNWELLENYPLEMSDLDKEVYVKENLNFKDNFNINDRSLWLNVDIKERNNKEILIDIKRFNKTTTYEFAMEWNSIAYDYEVDKLIKENQALLNKIKINSSTEQPNIEQFQLEKSTTKEAEQWLKEKEQFIEKDNITITQEKAEIKTNFIIKGEEDIGLASGKTKYNQNILAMAILKDIESEDRIKASFNEQKFLDKFSGFGGIPKVFDNENTNWANEYEILMCNTVFFINELIDKKRTTKI